MPGSADGVSAVPGGCKKKWQPLSDLVGLHGTSLCGRITHETRLGLWLNSGRAVLRAAWIAGGADIRQLNPAVCRALAETDAQGNLDYWRLETELRRYGS